MKLRRDEEVDDDDDDGTGEKKFKLIDSIQSTRDSVLPDTRFLHVCPLRQ